MLTRLWLWRNGKLSCTYEEDAKMRAFDWRMRRSKKLKAQRAHMRKISPNTGVAAAARKRWRATRAFWERFRKRHPDEADWVRCNRHKLTPQGELARNVIEVLRARQGRSKRHQYQLRIIRNFMKEELWQLTGMRLKSATRSSRPGCRAPRRSRKTSTASARE